MTYRFPIATNWIYPGFEFASCSIPLCSPCRVVYVVLDHWTTSLYSVTFYGLVTPIPYRKHSYDPIKGLYIPGRVTIIE